VVDDPVRHGLGRPDQGIGHCGHIFVADAQTSGGASASQHPAHDVGHPGTDLGQHVGEGLLGPRLPVQDRPTVTMVGDELDEGAQAPPHLFVRRQVLDRRGGDRLHQAQTLAVQAGDEEFFLRAQVGVDHRLGDPGRLRDLVDRCGVVAVPGEDRHGGVEHLLLAHLARQPPE
jgi:hypothetical protein